MTLRAQVTPATTVPNIGFKTPGVGRENERNTATIAIFGNVLERSLDHIRMVPPLYRAEVVPTAVSGNTITFSNLSDFDSYTSEFYVGGSLLVMREVNGKLAEVGKTQVVSAALKSRFSLFGSTQAVAAGEGSIKWGPEWYMKPGATRYFVLASVDGNGKRSAWTAPVSFNHPNPISGASGTVATRVNVSSLGSRVLDANLPVPQNVVATPVDGGRNVQITWTPLPNHAVVIAYGWHSDVNTVDLDTLTVDGTVPIQTTDMLWFRKEFGNSTTADVISPRVYRENSISGKLRPFHDTLNGLDPKGITYEYLKDGNKPFVRYHVPAGETFTRGYHAHGGALQTWYEVPVIGKTYAVRAELRADAPINVTMRMQSAPNEARQLAVTSEWKTFTEQYTFTAVPQDATARFTSVSVVGPCTIDIALMATFDAAGDLMGFAPGQDAYYVDSGAMSLRMHGFIATNPWSYSMEDALGTLGRRATRGGTFGQHFRLMKQMREDHNLTGQLNPWVQIEPHMDNDELQFMAGWFCTPYNAAAPASRYKDGAALRVSQGQIEPWQNVFDRVTMEVGNEPWNSLGPFYAVRGIGGRSPGWVNGKLLDRYAEALMAAPGYNADRWKYYLGGWGAGQGFTRDSANASVHADFVGPADYNGGWDSGLTEALQVEDPQAVFYTLANSNRGTGADGRGNGIRTMVAFLEELSATRAKPIKYMIYESGPGYSLNGLNGASVTQAQSDSQEKLMKSVAGGTATLDAWLTHAANGTVSSNFFGLGSGPNWNGRSIAARGGAYNPPFMWASFMNNHLVGEVRRLPMKRDAGLRDPNNVPAGKALKIYEVKRADGSVAYALCNVDPVNAQSVKLHVGKGSWTRYHMTGDMYATNFTLATKDDIAIIEEAMPAGFASGGLSVTIPPGKAEVYIVRPSDVVEVPPVIPTIAAIPAQSMSVGDPDRAVQLTVTNAASIAVSPAGQGVTLAGTSLIFSGAQERDSIYTVTVTSTTGHTASTTVHFVVQTGLSLTAVVTPNPLIAGQPGEIVFNVAPDTPLKANVGLSGTGNKRTFTAPLDDTINVIIDATKVGYNPLRSSTDVVPPLHEIVTLADNTFEIRNVTSNTAPFNWTITKPTRYAGTRQINPADGVGGPIRHIAPVITGTATVGSVLTLDPGLWLTLTDSMELTWTWPDGSTGRTYTVRAEDQGTSVSVTGEAIDANGVRAMDANSIAIAAGQASSGTLWVGDYDATSVTVTGNTIEGATNVRFAATPVSGGTTITTAVIAVDPTYKFARGTITGLAAGTEYTIRLQTGAGNNIGEAGWCKTRPSTRQAFKLGFSSCGERTRNHPIYSTIWDQNPDMQAFLHLGDRGYFDITTNNPALFHQYDDAIFAQSHQAGFHRKPVVYVWDDHDFGADNATANSPVRPAALSWYRNRVPARPLLTGASDPVYRLWSPMPGVKVAMLDVRADRYSTSTIIGSAQEAWLTGVIQGLATDEILIICTMVPWISTTDTDTWFGSAAIRTRLANEITANAPGRVFGIAGDAHMLAFDDGTNNQWGGFPIYQASPLGRSNSTKGGPYSGGTVTATQQQYGTLEFTPITGGWSVVFKGFSVDAAGVQTQRLTHTATLRAPTNTAPAFTGTSAIAGGTEEGATLTANAGTFTGSPTPTVSYQWRIDGTNVSGATSQTFVRPSGVGKVPSVVITLANGTAPNATRTITAAATTAAAGSKTAAYRNAVLAQSPQFLLLNPGTTSIPDESTNGRNATIDGTQGTHVATGPFGLPVFRGTTSCSAFVPHDAAFNGTSWSVAFFIHPNGSTVSFLGHFQRGGDQKLATNSADPSLVALRYSALNDSGSIPNILDPAAWNFVCMTFDATTGEGRTYSAPALGAIAQRHSKTVANSLHSTTDDICFNGRKVGATIDRRGATAHAGMARWNRVLTQAEIETIYQAVSA